jgi:hypothetical protein
VGRAFSPLDEELGLGSGSLSPQAQEWLVRLGAWMPFKQAAQMLGALTGIQVSQATARRQTEAAGGAYEAVQTAEVEEIKRVLPQTPQRAARQMLSADGAFVPLVHGQWGEVKTLALGEVQRSRRGEPCTCHLSYFSRLAEAGTFEELALVETHRRGLEQAHAVCAVLDGAEWLQGLVDYHRPDAVRILDFAHAAEYISAIGQAVSSTGTDLGASWLSELLHRLKHEGPLGVLAELQALREGHPQVEEVGERLTYLEKRVDQMQYPTYQAQGWPIGSGSVESAHKVVMQARLKGAGMHWQRTNVNPMLALRTAVCNDRWAEAWGALRNHQHRQRGHERQDRAEAHFMQGVAQILVLLARCKPPIRSSELVASGCPAAPVQACEREERQPNRVPAANHPWRRSLITRRRAKYCSVHAK